MTRAMGLDVGTKTIGVALSDPLYLIAQAHTTIKRTTLAADLAAVEELIDAFSIQEMIIGLPKHMNNQMSDSARRAKSFGAELTKKGYAVFYQDERLSTVQANTVLKKTGVRREKRKTVVDAIAATFILQQWLDRREK
ncbi:Holliday junction resolvase RuvX [uncultured Murdochiella sp.]|uniref:Holliday junction resolvase RuvX n=1 Tax=uncultured Murdochiella sp. TaxID=1586095 RepID=UPI002803B8E0|nr:Holliday junction resolvase RuvX [uncultured Murdochiella sp.]